MHYDVPQQCGEYSDFSICGVPWSTIPFPQKPQWEGTHWKTIVVGLLFSSCLQSWTRELLSWLLAKAGRAELESDKILALSGVERRAES
ncbi:hypothetical protein TNCV_1444241 [Trichonephila clavipes]|nr:hypothetical protein TNCV_1444241 [Trichonephila clavipes]